MNRVSAVFLLLLCMSMFAVCGAGEEPVPDLPGEISGAAMELATLSPAPTSAPTPKPTPSPYCHGSYDEVGSFCAYIQEFEPEEEHIVVLPIEWLSLEDEERIAELELDVEHTFLDGYHMIDWGFSEMEIPITQDTEYHFIDWGNEHMDLERVGSCTITKEEEIFITYWQEYGSMMSKYPFFFEVNEDGTLKCLSEKMIP